MKLSGNLGLPVIFRLELNPLDLRLDPYRQIASD
jgi:hypothetical protein